MWGEQVNKVYWFSRLRWRGKHEMVELCCASRPSNSWQCLRSSNPNSWIMVQIVPLERIMGVGWQVKGLWWGTMRTCTEMSCWWWLPSRKPTLRIAKEQSDCCSLAGLSPFWTLLLEVSSMMSLTLLSSVLKSPMAPWENLWIEGTICSKTHVCLNPYSNKGCWWGGWI